MEACKFQCARRNEEFIKGNLLFTDYETIGCYKDTGNRAITPLEGKDSILDGSYVSRQNPIAKCAVAACLLYTSDAADE